jgi:hypothetical protein
MDFQRRIYGWAATVVAGLVASHLVTLAWRLATRSRPPADTEDPRVPTSTAVTFAAVLAAATAVAQTLAARHTRRRSNGPAA